VIKVITNFYIGISVNSTDTDHTMSIQNESSFMRSKRNPFENSNYNGNLKNKKEIFNVLTDPNETNLIFSSDKEDILNKWAVVLNYFITK